MTERDVYINSKLNRCIVYTHGMDWGELYLKINMISNAICDGMMLLICFWFGVVLHVIPDMQNAAVKALEEVFVAEK
ncbi:hypothetical protein SCACP_38310 [Sporomusa carbonis]|uniref:hypothetical protein n=1 Tax=Sporomusa carbonis TaxID=3076075 RepID=UPI003A777467